MKKLLSLVALLALAATLPADEATAGLRGAFDPLTNGSSYNTGLANGCQSPSLRTIPNGANGGIARIERWFAFSSRSQAVGFESSREIWMGRNQSQVGPNIDGGALPGPIDPEARQPLLRDPTGVISYTDPAWSPNGRYLAYVLTDHLVSKAEIYYQEFVVSTNAFLAGQPVGAPVLIVPAAPGVRHRHPDWSPNGNALVFDSDATGLSIDVYYVQVFPTIGTPTRQTFVDNRAEQNPAWAADGFRIAYDTNRFGPNVIEITDLGFGVTLAETNFATISHSNPDWDTSGNIYYEAPQNEDIQLNSDIWRINPITQAKCPILLDNRGDAAISVSSLTNVTGDGVPYNTFVFESQAASFGLGIWRGNPVNSCVPPLPMHVDLSPHNISLTSGGNLITADLSFPQETIDAGYQAISTNGPREGIRMRRSIFPSPVLVGVPPNQKAGGGAQAGIADFSDQGTQSCNVKFDRRAVVTRLIALGLVDQEISCITTAYSNITGRGFLGFGILRVNNGSLAGSAVKLMQNSPNPFNPATKIQFATSKPGHVTLRVYNVQGALVKTLADKHVEAGMHEASWDGRNQSGQSVASGVYYAKVFSAGGNSDVIKMVVAK